MPKEGEIVEVRIDETINYFFFFFICPHISANDSLRLAVKMFFI